LAAHVAATAEQPGAAQSIVAGDLRVGIAFGDVRDPLVSYDLPAVGGALMVVDDVARTLTLVPSSAIEHLEHLTCIDPSIRATRVKVVGAAMLSLAGDATADVFLRADLLVAAQLAGIADAVTTLAVEYAKTRTQFGKPIGSFQAISHRCADM